ncbi:MAG: nucleoside deaminase [Candidatus Omnitrophota bacterium]|nr:nucleoside deaminase [Candidatus Omnitrophota bacterium]MDZ4242039.1 nucleoside deaminase [Candidatus Omnitrophota bacterium]
MTNSRDEQFMRQAILWARRGIRQGQTPFGACIVKDGRVVSRAHNRVWKKTDITAHAEIEAIRRACKKLKTVRLTGCVIYSTCEPCPMCFSACHWADIAKIVYGADINDARKAGFRELSISSRWMRRKGRSRTAVVPGCLRQDNRGLFSEWRRRRNRRAY